MNLARTWYWRLGAPVIWQIGACGCLRRAATNIQLLPAVWLFGDTGDYVVADAETDRCSSWMCTETRDLTEHLCGYCWMASGTAAGQATVNGVQGEKLNNVGVGLTLGSTPSTRT